MVFEEQLVDDYNKINENGLAPFIDSSYSQLSNIEDFLRDVVLSLSLQS